MHSTVFHRYYLKVMITFLLLAGVCFAQVDSTKSRLQFDSELLRLKVPEAFQKSSLKLEIFADSSWQLYRGSDALSFSEAMTLLGQSEKLKQYETHLEQESEYLREYRSRRIFALVTAVGAGTYLTFAWSKGWLYQIPGYAALAVAGERLWVSRRIEIQALREQYYLQTIINPSAVQDLVDDYNFQLYQYLSNAGIQFRDS